MSSRLQIFFILFISTLAFSKVMKKSFDYHSEENRHSRYCYDRPEIEAGVGQAIVFSEECYQGQYKILEEDEITWTHTPWKINSILLGKGASLTIFTDSIYRGKSLFTDHSITRFTSVFRPRLHKFKDNINSIILYPTETCVKFYERPNYQGNSHVICKNIKDIDPPARYKSVLVGVNTHLLLFTKENYEGHSENFNEDVPNLLSQGFKQIGSLEIVPARGCAWFFTKRNFKGDYTFSCRHENRFYPPFDTFDSVKLGHGSSIEIYKKDMPSHMQTLKTDNNIRTLYGTGFGGQAHFARIYPNTFYHNPEDD